MCTGGMPSNKTPPSEWGFFGKIAEKIRKNKLGRHLNIDEAEVNKNFLTKKRKKNV